MLGQLKHWLKSVKHYDAAQLQLAQLEALLRASPDFYAGWIAPDPKQKDNDNKFVLIAPALANFLSLRNLTHPLQIEQAFTIGDAAMFHGFIERLENENLGFECDVALNDDLTFCSVRGQKLSLPIGKDKNADFYLLWIRDTTARVAEKRHTQKNNDLIRANADKLQILVDLFPRPLWLRDTDMTLQWCNRAYAAALDMSVNDALENRTELFVTANDRSGHELAERAFRAGKPLSEIKPTVINGERRLMEITEWPLSSMPLIAGFALDQTQLDELQIDLKRHVKAHAAVLQNMATAIAIFSADTRLRFFNHAFQLLMELDERWLTTEPTMNEILEALRDRRKLPEQSDFPKFKKSWLRFFTDLIKPHEELLHLPDGSALRMMAVPHPMGGLLFTFEDVTDRYTMESSYNTLIAVQRATLNNLGEAIALFGADGQLKLWNPSFQSIWQFSDSQLANHPHITALTNIYHAYFEADNWSAAKHALVDQVLTHDFTTTRLTRKDGKEFDISIVPLPDGAALCRMMDVTDSGLVEAAIHEKTAALEAADRLKNDFLVNVSYQLRTPLNTIMGFSELINAEDVGKINARQKDYLSNILTAAHQLQTLVDDILDLASIEAGFMTLNRNLIDVHKLLNQVYSLSIDWTRKSSLHLDVQCPAGIRQVDADETRLKQVLLALVHNAVKWTPEKGGILLSAENSPDNPKQILITVSDTGSGITAAEQTKLFGAFESGNKRDQKSGAGLGLALVKKIITLHGGDVSIESHQDWGTKVTIALPC